MRQLNVQQLEREEAHIQRFIMFLDNHITQRRAAMEPQGMLRSAAGTA